MGRERERERGGGGGESVRYPTHTNYTQFKKEPPGCNDKSLMEDIELCTPYVL